MENCYYHSSKPAIHSCAHCKKNICENCTIQVEGEPFCQICWDGFVSKIQSNAKNEEVIYSSIPWQRRKEIGILQAFVETARMVAFQPALFFRRLPAGTDMAPPLFFAIICIIVFWFPMNIFYFKYFFPAFLDMQQQEIFQRFQSLSSLDILFLPLDYMIYYIILASLLQQALVTLFQGSKGYAATLQIRCYSMIVQCLWLIPVLGIFLSEILSFVLCTRGFQVTQQLSLPRALLVAAVPALISLVSIPFMM